MNRETFDYLLDKYLQNQCTPDEAAMVESWYSLVGSDKEMPKSKMEWETIRQQVWDKIKYQMNQNSSWISTVFSSKILRIAASLFLIGGLWASYMFFAKKFDTHISSTNYENHESIPKKVVLSDGSIITLFADAELTVDSAFNNTDRKVSLKGEAHFDVASNANKPFYVESGNVITKVIGTSFRIKNDKKETVEIAVTEGRVSVFEKSAEQMRENGVVLTPNQKVVYFKEKQLFVTGIVEKPAPIIVEEQTLRFVYTNESLKTVLENIEKTYGIEIVLENENIANCKITGDLESDSLYEKLDIISQILGIEYKIKGTTILISGKGC
jgi:transmembrane sensor